MAVFLLVLLCRRNATVLTGVFAGLGKLFVHSSTPAASPRESPHTHKASCLHDKNNSSSSSKMSHIVCLQPMLQKQAREQSSVLMHKHVVSLQEPSH